MAPDQLSPVSAFASSRALSLPVLSDLSIYQSRRLILGRFKAEVKHSRHGILAVALQQ